MSILFLRHHRLAFVIGLLGLWWLVGLTVAWGQSPPATVTYQATAHVGSAFLRLTSVRTDTPGWVLAYASDQTTGEMTTEMLGLTYLPLGYSSVVDVVLSRPVTANSMYYLVFYADTGEVGTFDGVQQEGSQSSPVTVMARFAPAAPLQARPSVNLYVTLAVPEGWTQHHTGRVLVLYPQEGTPFVGSQTLTPYFYLEIVPLSAATDVSTAQSTLLNNIRGGLYGHEATLDEPPVVVESRSGIRMVGQFLGGTNQVTRYRAFVGTLMVDSRTAAYLVAWSPASTWESDVTAFNAVLRSLTPIQGGITP